MLTLEWYNVAFWITLSGIWQILLNKLLNGYEFCLKGYVERKISNVRHKRGTWPWNRTPFKELFNFQPSNIVPRGVFSPLKKSTVLFSGLFLLLL